MLNLSSDQIKMLIPSTLSSAVNGAELSYLVMSLLGPEYSIVDTTKPDSRLGPICIARSGSDKTFRLNTAIVSYETENQGALLASVCAIEVAQAVIDAIGHPEEDLLNISKFLFAYSLRSCLPLFVNSGITEIAPDHYSIEADRNHSDGGFLVTAQFISGGENHNELEFTVSASSTHPKKPLSPLPDLTKRSTRTEYCGVTFPTLDSWKLLPLMVEQAFRETLPHLPIGYGTLHTTMPAGAPWQNNNYLF